MNVLGYGHPRPKEHNYQDFAHKLVDGLSKLEIDGISLMFYGSYVRGDYVPGRSDIDGLLIFPDDVIINKDNLLSASRIVCSALKDNDVPLQLTVSDLHTMIDGRFNTYCPSFKNYFYDEGLIILGDDYRKKFCYELASMPQQSEVRFNLKKVRSNLLLSEYYRQSDYNTFIEKFNKALDAVSRSSKQVALFSSDVLHKNRFSAIDVIAQNYPNVNLDPITRIKALYSNPNELDKIYREHHEVQNMWVESLTFMEELLKTYIDKNPKKHL